MSRKTGLEVNGKSTLSWKNLFKAMLKTADLGPPLIVFRDLRQGLSGGRRRGRLRIACKRGIYVFVYIMLLQREEKIAP